MALEYKRTETGQKARQREDTQDRTVAYQQMRRNFIKRGLYSWDVDSVEWVRHNDNWRAALVLELQLCSRVEGGKFWPPPGDNYLATVLTKREEGATAEMSRTLAAALGCEAYLVVFDDDARRLWAYNLTRRVGWKEFDREGYEAFLEEKRRRKLAEMEGGG